MQKNQRLKPKEIVPLGLLIGLLLSVCLPVFGQSGGNPFDLIPRLPEPPAVDSIATATGNPFDLIAAPRPAGAVRKAPAAVRHKTVDPLVQFNRLKLFIILGILVLLAFLVTVLRSLVNKSILAFINDNVMSQLYREREGRGLLPFLMLYILFFVNGGVFLFFLMKQQHLQFPVSDPALLSFCIAGVSILFLLKHFVLNLLGFTFPVAAEISRYNFTIIIFSIIIGLFLVPVNIFMAYTPVDFLSFVTKGALGTIALIYLFRTIRSLVIANNFLLFHKFHFLLYICVVEIAPVFVLLRFVLDRL